VRGGKVDGRNAIAALVAANMTGLNQAVSLTSDLSGEPWNWWLALEEFLTGISLRSLLQVAGAVFVVGFYLGYRYARVEDAVIESGLLGAIFRAHDGKQEVDDLGGAPARHSGDDDCPVPPPLPWQMPNFIGCVGVDRGVFHFRRCHQVSRARTGQRPLRIMRMCQSCANGSLMSADCPVGFSPQDLDGGMHKSAPRTKNVLSQR
jgi:hypothetical protein